MWARLKASVSTIHLLAEIGRTYPGRSALVVACLIAAGLVEGISVVALIPLLSILFGDMRNEGDKIYQTTQAAFDFIGLPLSLGGLLGLIVLAVAFKAVLKFSAMTYVGFTVSHMTAQLRSRLLNALMQAEWSFFMRRQVGTFANAISTEAGRATSAFSAAYSVLSTGIQVAIYLVAALVVSWQTLLIAIVVGAGLMALFRPTVVRSRQAGKLITDHTSSLVARLTDILVGLKPIKAMAIEERIGQMIVRETEGLEAAQRHQVVNKWLQAAGSEPAIVAIMAIGLYLSVVAGHQSPSTVTVIALMFYRTLNSFSQLQGLLQLVASYEAGYWLVESLIRDAGVARESRAPGAVPRLSRAIDFADVSFAHGDQTIFARATFSIPAQGLTVVVGPSGTGKTTAIDLLIGLYRPSEGRILVDGVPLEQLDQRLWRESLGYVPQETVLLHDTVLANVVLGQPGLTEVDAEAALRLAGAWEFIAALPDGVDTMVGERGQRFSGGQRQRIAIARALVRKPSLLILDEAMAALDPATERDLCATVKALSATVPVVAVSHQSAIVELADRVLVAGDRTLTEAGDAATVRKAEAGA
jgi:ATP-binding cassette, subfamily C, bacterial